MSAPGVTNFIPTYASYNWTGAPADYTQVTNAQTGGDSSMSSGFGLRLHTTILTV